MWLRVDARTLLIRTFVVAVIVTSLTVAWSFGADSFLVSEEWLPLLDQSCFSERAPAEFWRDATVYQKRGVVLEADDATAGLITSGFWVLDQFTPGVVTDVFSDSSGSWFATVEFGEGRRNWEPQRVNVKNGSFGRMELLVERVGEQESQVIEAERGVEGLKLAKGVFGSVIGDDPGGAVSVRFPVELLALGVPRIGARVVRGPDWSSGYVDGRGRPVAYVGSTPEAEQFQGTVEKSISKSRVVEVLWDATERRGVHRFDHNGFYDVLVVKEGIRPSGEQIIEFRKMLRQQQGFGVGGNNGEPASAVSSMPTGQYGSDGFYGGSFGGNDDLGVQVSAREERSAPSRSRYENRLKGVESAPLTVRTPPVEPSPREEPPKPYDPEAGDIPKAPTSAWVTRQDSSKFRDELFGEGNRSVNDEQLFGGKVVFTKHPDCVRPDEKKLANIFDAQPKPSEVFADGPVNILITGDSREVAGFGTVKDVRDSIVSQIKQSYPEIDWHSNDVYLIDGVQWVVLELTTTQKNNAKRRFLVASTVRETTQFNIIIRLEDKFLWKWLEVARLMVASLRMSKT